MVWVIIAIVSFMACIGVPLWICGHDAAGSLLVGLGIGFPLGIVGNMLASRMHDGALERARRERLSEFCGEFDCYLISNGVAHFAASGTATVEYEGGGVISLIYTEKRGDVWSGRAEIGAAGSGVMSWRYVHRAGVAKHVVGRKHVQLGETTDATEGAALAIYLEGEPKVEYGNEILMPKGKMPAKSASSSKICVIQRPRWSRI